VSATTRTRESFPALSIEIHGPQIAPALLLSAELLVDTPFESLAHVRAFRPEIVAQLRHAVIHSEGRLAAILSFYADGKRLAVVNRLVRLPDAVITACAATMLQKNPTMRSVEFNDLYNIYPGNRTGPMRSLSWSTIDCAEVDLPGSYDDYLQTFGSATRKNLRYCARRLERESPSVKFRILEREEITEEIVEAIVELNHRRMASKGKTSGMDRSYTAHLGALSRSHGVACIAADGAKIVGGTLCTQVGAGWTLHVIAHDPSYNHLRLGLLCLLNSVREAIARGIQRFNFLWGASDYKRLFGARVSPLSARRYYRHFGCQLLQPQDVKDCAVQTLRRGIASWRSARARSPGK